MATHTAKTSVSKPSFAKIAAMAPPASSEPPPSGRENETPFSATSPAHSCKPRMVESPSASQVQQDLRDSMTRLVVKEPSLVGVTLNDQQKSNISRAGLKFDDDQTQVSTSSTKPASLDGKSTISGALDEKESLRPDDSASVKAAEDDDFGPGLTGPNSRMSSEAEGRAFGNQFYEISESIGPDQPRMQPLSRRAITGIEEEGPQMTHPPLRTVLPATTVSLPPPQLIAPTGPLIDYKYQEPDEKLFEALQSPKDRLFLLMLEQEVITFVRDSTEPLIDLPPCNSFCRLLAHKLADYYALTHFVDNAVSSVRLYRTPYCRLPTPLGALASKVPTPIDTAQSSQPAMKIMRRAGLGRPCRNPDSGGNTAEASATPSKAGSENGDDSQRGTGVASPTDSNMAKEKSSLTREEREAKYKETRERIFGPESENADSNEAVNELSRASSRNEKKKKKHKNNDDGFEARSQFNAYYPQVQYQPASYDPNANAPAYYSSPYAMQPGLPLGQAGTVSPGILQQGFQQGYQSMSSAQAYSAHPSGTPMMIGYDVQNAAAFNTNQHMPSQYYPQMQQGYSLGQQSPAMSSPALSNNGQFPRPQSQMSDHQWSQNGYTYSYQSVGEQQHLFSPQMPVSSPMHSPNSMSGVQSIPYQYGQLPIHPGLQGTKSQHPLPGSYKSQAFNPQTRVFVPNGGPTPSQIVHGGNSPNHQMARSPATSIPNGSQCAPYGQQAPTYPQMAPMPNPPSVYSFGTESRNYGPRKSSAQSSITQSPAQSSLSKWGTPSHLPPKPPPPETSSLPDVHHSLPMNNQFNVAVQPMHGGQPMPSYQNGVYSMPGASPQAT